MSDTLREYLIALGFKVDDASYKKFNAALASSAKEAAGLGSIVVSTATAIGVAVEKVAREYEGLFYQSQRMRESVSNIRSFAYAAKQIGLSQEQSIGALESFTTARRLNPGVNAFVRLGGGSGQSPIEQLENFVAHQKKLYGENAYYVAAMNAQIAGIPETTFLQIWNNLPKLRAADAEMKRMRQEAGLDNDDLTKKSVTFTNAWDHLMASLSIGRDRIADDLIGPVTTGVKAIDDLVQAFSRADVVTKGWLGSIVGITSALGGTTAALALVARFLGIRGLVGAGVGLAGAAALPLAAIGDGILAGRQVARTFGPIGGSGPSGGGSASRAAIMDYFQKLGWSREAAAGIAASLSQESGFNPSAIGDNGQAYGVAQWHPDRQRAFAKFAGKDIRQSTLQEQLAFIQYELTQGSDLQARRAGQKLKGVTSAYDAGVVFSGLYERPADVYGEAHRRGLQAQNFFDAPLAPGSAGGGDVTINQTNNNTIHAADARAAGDALKSANDRSNADMLRNMKGAAR